MLKQGTANHRGAGECMGSDLGGGAVYGCGTDAPCSCRRLIIILSVTGEGGVVTKKIGVWFVLFLSM